MAAMHVGHDAGFGPCLDMPTAEPWSQQKEVSTGVRKCFVSVTLTSCICFFQTSIMAVEYDLGVIIGADSRTTSG